MYRKAIVTMLDTVGCLRILVVARSASLRLRIRQLLGTASAAALLDQTADTADGVRLALRLRPHIILCDAQVAADPALLALFDSSIRRPAPKLVLLDDDPALRRRGYPVPLSALLPADLPAHELVAYLSTMVDVRQAPETAQPPLSDCAAPPRGRPAVVPSRRATDKGWSPTSGMHEPTVPRGRPPIPAPVPPIVGPPDQQALERAAQVLMHSLYPVSMAVVELCSLPGSATPTDASTCGRLSQRLETTIRQCLRRDDLVCTLESLTCAALLPGLLHEQQGLITNRLATAMQNVEFDHYADGLRMKPAISIVSWEPGRPEANLMNEARAACSIARASLLRAYQPAAAW